MTIRHFDQATWLAHGAIEAQQIGPPRPPAHVALPGAKVAVAHDRLLAHHERGHQEQEIVDRANARWREENRERLAAHDAWVQGPYVGAIAELRQRALEAQAEDLRRRAILDRILAEHDQDA